MHSFTTKATYHPLSHDMFYIETKSTISLSFCFSESLCLIVFCQFLRKSTFVLESFLIPPHFWQNRHSSSTLFHSFKYRRFFIKGEKLRTSLGSKLEFIRTPF